jgi:hypothetical protein
MSNLICGAEAGADGGVDCSPVACGVGVFAGEEESVCDRFGEEFRGVKASRGYVGVGSEGVGVLLPVVGDASLKGFAELSGL